MHIGADPELFLQNEAGKFISSIGLIGGSKDFPQPIGEGCSVQEDNVAVEFNIPPAANAEDFIKSINYNKTYLAQRASELGLNLVIQPSAVFDEDQLENPQARVFGCEPDYNAWKDGRRNPRPRSSDPNLRSAGGHIHVEIGPEVDRLTMVKAMDLFVGCLMVEWDDDVRRRELYGSAGAFRYKPYGIEYRTASNRWIESDERIRWVWEQTNKAVEFAKSGYVFTELDAFLIQKCINESDLGALEQLKDIFAEVL